MKLPKIALALLSLSATCLWAGEAADAGKAEAKPLADQLVGYWAPVPDKMAEMMLAEMPEEVKANPEMLKAVKEQAAEMAGKMAIHFDGSRTFVFGPAGPMESTYKITSTDEKTGTITAEIKDADGEIEKGKAIVDGDKLQLIEEEGGVLHLVRITEEEFKKRTASE